MKTIVIYNRKGGVGKTVSCVNIAGCLDKKYGKKVLVVDLDATANATSYLLLHDIETVKYSLLDIFKDSDIDPDKVIYKARVMDKKAENLVDTNIYVIPATRDLDKVSINYMYVLREFLAKLQDQYDYCLVDCAPALSEMTINALCAADYLIIPTLAERSSVIGYGTVLDEVNAIREKGFNVDIRILGVFLNRVNKLRALDAYYQKLWKDKGKGKLFSTFIRDSAEIENAEEFAKPIHYYKKCAVMEDYEKLTEEILSKIRICDKK